MAQEGQDLGHGDQVGDEMKGASFLSVLGGAAWEACKHLDLDKIAEKDGWQLVIQTLENKFEDPKRILQVQCLEECS